MVDPMVLVVAVMVVNLTLSQMGNMSFVDMEDNKDRVKFLKIILAGLAAALAATNTAVAELVVRVVTLVTTHLHTAVVVLVDIMELAEEVDHLTHPEATAAAAVALAGRRAQHEVKVVVALASTVRDPVVVAAPMLVLISDLVVGQDMEVLATQIMVDSLAVAVVLLKTIPILAAAAVEVVPFVSFGALLVMAIQDPILRLESVDLIIPPMLRFGVIIL
tara:strand:+ start:116 stop:772 length:657 start_codon:yes stop_codon:yes gene_type:complete